LFRVAGSLLKELVGLSFTVSRGNARLAVNMGSKPIWD